MRAFVAAIAFFICATLTQAQTVHIIDTITPDHVVAGSGDTLITLRGVNLNPPTFPSVIFNAISISGSMVDAHTVTVTIPAADLKQLISYAVHINSTPATNNVRFQVLSPLLPISSYVPSQFVAAVNTPVTVYGLGFDSSSTILFDWQPLTTTFVSATQLTATVPSGLITSAQTHHVFVYAGAFTAASIATLQSVSVIGTDQPQISLSNVVIGTSLTGTATVRSLQNTTTLSNPFYTISGPNSADFSESGGTCINGKVLVVGASCSVQVTATPAAFPSPPPGWTPSNSYALNFEIVDNANRNPNATQHLQKVTAAGTSGQVAPGLGFGAAGAIYSSALDAAGTGYAVNDTFTVNGGTGLATGYVTSIGGGGAATGINIILLGSGYSVGTNIATTATSGSGSGMTVNISAVYAGPWNESGGNTVEGSVTWTDQGPYVVNVSESATLTINSSAANNPQSVPLSLTKVLAPGGSIALLVGSLSLNPAGYDFGSVVESTPTSRTVTLLSAGVGYLNLSTPFYAITGTNAADFTVSGGTCANGEFLNNGARNNRGQSCTFNLGFTPSTTSGESALLTLNWTSIGGAVGSLAQALTGTGHAAATKIHLTWTASTSSSVTGYNVYRGTQTGGPYTLLASPGNVTSYDDTTPVHGNTYCYVVTTVGSNPPYTTTESVNSGESCATF